MALRKSENPLVKVTLNLNADDWEFLKGTFLKTGAGAAVRRIVNEKCKHIREKTKLGTEELAAVELEG